MCTFPPISYPYDSLHFLVYNFHQIWKCSAIILSLFPILLYVFIFSQISLLHSRIHLSYLEAIWFFQWLLLKLVKENQSILQLLADSSLLLREINSGYSTQCSWILQFSNLVGWNTNYSKLCWSPWMVFSTFVVFSPHDLGLVFHTIVCWYIFK